MDIHQDETGIFVQRNVGYERDYIVRTLVQTDQGEVVYQFDLNSRVLKASIEPGCLEILVDAQGWVPGRDLKLPDTEYTAKERMLLHFPAVNVVQSITTSNGDYIHGFKQLRQGGIFATAREFVVGRKSS